jgi:DNA-binding transcriptional MerR regulator
VDQPELPNKLYFRIGEVAKIVGVKPYVLRYWETEFPSIKPGKTPSRHRLYRRRDVELLLDIKHLLYEERFTIAGAKKQLKDLENSAPQAADASLSQTAKPGAQAAQTAEPRSAPSSEQRRLLRAIRQEIQALCTTLERKPRLKNV